VTPWLATVTSVPAIMTPVPATVTPTWMMPSSSTMYSPVMSPSSVEASNTEGWSKMKVAVPLEPSLQKEVRPGQWEGRSRETI